jgi:DNA polymerase-3 subunit alpha
MYINLHNHSIHSPADGLCELSPMVARTKELGQNSIALTDHGTMSGMVDFYLACKDQNVKPIYGIEAYTKTWSDSLGVAHPANWAPHLIILVKNKIGLKNLFQLLSISYSHGGKQELRMTDLTQYKEGLIVTSACMYGYAARLIIEHQILAGKCDASIVDHRLPIISHYSSQYMDQAVAFIKMMKKEFKEDFYIEVQNHGLEAQKVLNKELLSIASKLKIPLICTNDTHYVDPQDNIIHSILLSIRYKSDGQRVEGLRESNNMHLKSEQEMLFLFPQDIIDNTILVAEKVDADIFIPKKQTPKFDTHGLNPEDVLRDKTWLMAKEKWGQHLPDEITKRLHHELNTIISLGFADYILIVSDIIDNTIRISGETPGPGRGSVAGSLVAYVLGITRVNPLDHGLYFNRFMSPSRFVAELPDFGIKEVAHEDY